MEPLRFLSGTESLGSAYEGWVLDQYPEEDGIRLFRFHVFFNGAFPNAPLVHLGITGFDIAHDEAARLTATVENVTTEGFDIVLSTWLASRLWRVDVNWLAIGA